MAFGICWPRMDAAEVAAAVCNDEVTREYVLTEVSGKRVRCGLDLGAPVKPRLR
jgi:hypothetical protein